jgi:hypothetical protein
VIGVDSVSHFYEILGSKEGIINKLPDFGEFLDQRLINPAKWEEI